MIELFLLILRFIYLALTPLANKTWRMIEPFIFSSKFFALISSEGGAIVWDLSEEQADYVQFNSFFSLYGKIFAHRHFLWMPLDMIYTSVFDRKNSAF